MCCSCLHHLLPWVASCSFFMHHACCASCLVHVWCVYLVVCFFSIVSRFVAIVRIHSSTLGSASSVRLLHGLVLPPSGISGKMTATLDLITIIPKLVASFYRFAALPIFCSSSLPYCHEPLTFNTFPMQTIVWLCYRFAQPTYSVASCIWSWSLLHGGQDFVWDITISLILLMHLYTW